MDMFTLWSRSNDDEASERELEKLVAPEACIDLSGTYLRSPGGRLVTFTQDGVSGRADWEGNSFSYTVSGATVVNHQDASQRGTINGQKGLFTIIWSHGATYTQQTAGVPAPASVWEVLSAELFYTSVTEDGRDNGKADRFFTGSPRKLAKEVVSASGWDIFSAIQLFSTCTAAQQPKIDPWQFERATEVLSAFCSTHPAGHVRPSLEELLELWQTCMPLHETPIADAFVRQLFGEGGECDWRPRLRALRAMEFFASQGGYGREAAIAAAGEAEDLLHYLVVEMPQCCQEAAAVLRLLSGEQASALAKELPRLGPTLAPSPARPCRQPAEDVVPPEPAGADWASDPAPEPLREEPEVAEEHRDALEAEEFAGCCEEELIASMNLPDTVLDLVPHIAWHPAAGPTQGSPAWEANWGEEEQLVRNPMPELAAVPYEPHQPALGYHWLDKSMVEALSFATMHDAFRHLDVHIEELKRHTMVC